MFLSALKGRDGAHRSTGRRSGGGRGGRGGRGAAATVLLLVALLMALCAAPADAILAEDVKVAQPKGYDEDDKGRMASLRFDEPLPRFCTPTAIFTISLIAAYIYDEGVIAAALFGAIFQVVAMLMYLWTAIAANTDEAVWLYGLGNPKQVLSNKGAVGGFYFGLAFWGYTFLGGCLGETISWATVDYAHGGTPTGALRPYDKRHRHYKMGTLREIMGRGFSRLCCPAGLNRDTLPDEDFEEQAKAGRNTREMKDPTKTGGERKPTNGPGFPAGSRAGMGMDDTNLTNACVATAGGDLITWGVALRHLTIVAVVAAAAGPGHDMFTIPRYYWIGWAILVVTLALVLVLYQHREYGQFVLYPVNTNNDVIAAETSPDGHSGKGPHGWSHRKNAREAYVAIINKLMVLTPPFVHIILFDLAMAITYTVFDNDATFKRVRFAYSAKEARYMANQNLLTEFITVVIVWGVLIVVATTCYLVVIKNATNRK